MYNKIEKSLAGLSFSEYHPRKTVHERKISHFILLIKTYLQKAHL